MSLTAGSHLGAYEILSPIGAGGMGEVYRARDTKLNRDVALKVLPELFALDPERLARFRREAQVLASLNHPHIAAIYGLEESGGIQALVLELVEGPTLADVIAGGAGRASSPQYVVSGLSRTGDEVSGSSRTQTGLPLQETLNIARQIADAFEAAHEEGIIHRDLKPANIALAADGQVKVLDFGLAKALDPVAQGVSPADANSPTMSLGATRAGVILGTAAYMSPEQAKGRTADKRSDLWAFGCVLYEMLSGKRAFEGEDVSDTLAAVLRGEPDWSALPSDLPPAIRTLVQRCLAKDRRQRIADISTAQYVLAEPASLAAPLSTPAAVVAPPVAPPRPLWWRAMPVAATALLVAALTSAAWWGFRPPLPPPTVTRFSFTLPQGQVFANSTLRQIVVAMSPDGTQVVYVANNRLYLRSSGDLEPKAISGSDSQQGLRNPVFSPDGQSIVFWSGADNTLKRISVRGGAAVTICPADAPFGMSWGIDGIVFGQGSKGVMRVSPNGGQPERLVSVKEGEVAHGPQVLPGGQAVLFTLATGTGADRWDKAQVVVQSLKSGERKTLVNGGSDARHVPTGHIVYALGGTLFALPFDVKRLEVAGGPVPIVEGVQRTLCCPNSGSAQFSFADTGSLVYVPGTVSSSGRRLGLADRKGDLEILKLPASSYEHPRISPDGKRVALGTDDGQEAIVWIYDLAARPRCADSRLEGGIAFRSGLRTASTWRFNRIAKATWAFSGSAPMAPGPQSGSRSRTRERPTCRNRGLRTAGDSCSRQRRAPISPSGCSHSRTRRRCLLARSSRELQSLPRFRRMDDGSRITPTKRDATPSTSSRSRRPAPNIKFRKTILIKMTIIRSGRRTEKSCSTSQRWVHWLPSA